MISDKTAVNAVATSNPGTARNATFPIDLNIGQTSGPFYCKYIFESCFGQEAAKIPFSLVRGKLRPAHLFTHTMEALCCILQC